MTTLPWGRHYLMVEPEHFRVDYTINPFMDLADQPDPVDGAHRVDVQLREGLLGHPGDCPTKTCFPAVRAAQSEIV